MWAYRRALRVPWFARKTNRWVLDSIKSEKMLQKQLAARKLQYFGHVVRRGGLEKVIIQGGVEGKRRRGRPATAWFDDIRNWTGHGLAAASTAAADRRGWRELVRATEALFAPPDRERDHFDPPRSTLTPRLGVELRGQNLTLELRPNGSR